MTKPRRPNRNFHCLPSHSRKGPEHKVTIAAFKKWLAQPGKVQLTKLRGRMCEDLKDGFSIALGFEFPLFLPVPQMASQLSRGRTESDSSFGEPNNSLILSTNGASVE